MVRGYFSVWRLPSAASILTLALLLGSCADGDNVYDSMRRIVSDGAPTYNSVRLEQLQLDSVRYSGESFSWAQEGQGICCLDIFYGWLYRFDAEGRLIKRALGNGRSSNESIIKHYMIGTMSNDGELAIAGSSRSEFLAYTTPGDCIARFYKGKLYEGLVSDIPDFIFGPDYEKKVCHIGVVDMTEGKALKSEIQGLPSMFSEDKAKYRGMDFVMFDIDNQDNMYIGFAADSLVYVFDHNRKPKFAFGRSGVNMDTDYERFGSLDEMNAYRTNITKKGYYYWIEYIDETGVCFRSYKKGADSEYDGLQVYKDGKLLADCETPKGFKVVGYIAPYYYSQIIGGEEDGSLMVYRFKLD